MDVRLLFPTLYLAAHDLHGRDVTLTIDRLQVDDLQVKGGDTEKKPVLYFKETREKAEKAGSPRKEKRLVLNKTNAMTIARQHGHEVDDWPGKQITLYPTMVSAFGETVGAIRVRPKVGEEEPSEFESGV